MVTAEELQLFYQMGLMGKRDMSLAPDLRTGLEMAVLKMLAFRPEGLAEPPIKELSSNSSEQVPQQVKQEAEESLKKPEAVVETAKTEVQVEVVQTTKNEPELITSPKIVEIAEAQAETGPVAEIKKVDDSEAQEVKKEDLDLSLFKGNAQWIMYFHKLPFSGLLKAVVSEFVLVSVDGGKWQFSLDKEKAQLYNEQHNQQIADILSTYFSKTVDVTVVEQESDLQTPADYLKEKKQAAYDAALKELQNDSGLQGLIEQYSATIDMSSVKLSIAESKMKGLNDIMKQAQQMQEQMQKAQQELAQKEVQGESGAGLVKVVMNGRHDVKSVVIDESLLTEEKEILEDLIAAAVNDAVRKVESNNQDLMSGLTAGMEMPPGFKMPF